MSDDEFDEDLEDFDDEFDEDFDDEEEEGEEEAEAAAEEMPAEEAAAAAPPAAVTPSESLVSPDQIPFQVVFEVGRVNMTAQQLTDLQAGNILEVNPNAATGVNLVINGRTVGRGELVAIGDAIGVRVLEKG